MPLKDMDFELYIKLSDESEEELRKIFINTGGTIMNRDEILRKIQELKYEIKGEREDIETTKTYIGDLEREIEALENKLEKKPPLALWKPEVGESFYSFANPLGAVVPYFWRDHFDFGNISPTEKLAELKRDIRLATEEYKRKVAEFNGDWEADWGDVPQRKYYLHVVSYYTFIPHIRLKPTYTSAYCAEKEGFYFSWYVANNEQQVSKLKELYQKIIDLTKEYKKAEKEWRNEE